MTCRILDWSPRKWPFMSPFWVLMCLAVYFTPDLMVGAFERAHHLPISGNLQIVVLYIHVGLLGGFVLIMGLRRPLITNPLINGPYRKWLKTTPWHPGMPLPLGPITLNFYDLALVLASGFLLKILDLPPELAILVFGAAYTLSVILHLLLAGLERVSYLLIFGLLAMVWVLPDLRDASLIVVAMYPIEHLAIRQSFKAFPWEPLVPRHAVPLGWSFERLGPGPVKLHVSAFDALIVSLLVGLTVYLAFLKSFVEFRVELVPILVVVGCVAAFTRLGIYWEGISNPLGIFTRFSTGRLIIPRFDQIFIAPLLAVVVVLATWKLSKYFPIQPVVAGASATLVSLILLGMGPSLSRFRLVGTFNVSKNYSGASRKKSLPKTVDG